MRGVDIVSNLVLVMDCIVITRVRVVADGIGVERLTLRVVDEMLTHDEIADV